MLELEKNEKILKYVRKHWLPFIFELFFIGFLAIVPIIAYILIPTDITDQITDSINGDSNILFIFLYLLWAVILWMVIFYIWTDYYLDVWIITDERIIDIEQRGFFHREVSSLRLDRIQDVTITVNGIIPTMIGYGNVHVQTAGADRNFIIPKASHPETVKKWIQEAYSAAVTPGKSGV